MNLYHALPPVIPYASLMGESAGPDMILPAVPQLVTELVNAEQETVAGPANCRYFVHPDRSWEYRCPIQLFPGAMQLKVEGFRTHWNASIAPSRATRTRCTIELDAAADASGRRRKPTRKLEIDIRVEPLTGTPVPADRGGHPVRFVGRVGPVRSAILATTAPKIFESVRVYFQAAQEQRTRERWPLTQPLRVYPVLPDLDTAPTIDGHGPQHLLRRHRLPASRGGRRRSTSTCTCTGAAGAGLRHPRPRPARPGVRGRLRDRLRLRRTSSDELSRVQFDRMVRRALRVCRRCVPSRSSACITPRSGTRCRSARTRHAAGHPVLAGVPAHQVDLRAVAGRDRRNSNSRPTWARASAPASRSIRAARCSAWRTMKRSLHQRQRLERRDRAGAGGRELRRIGAIEDVEERVGQRAEQEAVDAAPAPPPGESRSNAS